MRFRKWRSFVTLIRTVSLEWCANSMRELGSRDNGRKEMETTHLRSFVIKGSKEMELNWARNGVERRKENRWTTNS